MLKNIILNAQNITIGYRYKNKQTTIASSLNFSVEKGKFVALLGKNGVGKSTLLRTLSRVQQPISGSVFIHQKELQKYTDLELAKTLSLVLTERLPESQSTVFDIVALGRQPYTNWIDKLTSEDIKKVNQALQLTEIEHLKHNYFYELSDGQLQRVLIARALAQDTELIILDEPTAHLDIHHTFKIFSLLKNLVKTTQKTIVISTHEVNLALKLADEFIILTGNNLHCGTSETLIKKDVFSQLFPKDLIEFNVSLKQFVIKE